MYHFGCYFSKQLVFSIQLMNKLIGFLKTFFNQMSHLVRLVNKQPTHSEFFLRYEFRHSFIRQPTYFNEQICL